MPAVARPDIVFNFFCSCVGLCPARHLTTYTRGGFHMSCKTPRQARFGRLAFTALTWLLPATLPVFAGDLSQRVKLEIPAQPLEAALRSLAKQADIQILFSPGLADGLNGPAVSGEMSPREALARLLKATPLEFEAEGKDTVAIRARKGPARQEPKR